MVPRLALRALYALKIVIDSRKSGFSDGLPQGFLSPTRGTEGVVKTIDERLGEKGKTLLAGETER